MRCRTEHRRRAEERGRDRRRRVAGRSGRRQAERGRVDEEQAEGGDRAEPVDRAADDQDDRELADEQEEEVAAAKSSASDLDHGRDARRQEQPGEHPAEGVGQEGAGQPRIGHDAERRRRASTPAVTAGRRHLGRAGVGYRVLVAVGYRSWLIAAPSWSCSPHQAGVARVPALGQQGHLHVVVDDRFRPAP